MEIGSFIELEFPTGKEYYAGPDVMRMNSGRAAIWHAFKTSKCKKILLPVYQCGSIKDFLKKKGVEMEFYNIDTTFTPIIDHIEEDTVVLIVNYFGIISAHEMYLRAAKYPKVIIDNCQAFYSSPLPNYWNIYSPRKFFGVPDGSYAIGPNINNTSDIYTQDYSSDTSLFLLKRIEYGCSSDVYADRKVNESRIDNADAKLMSSLTRKILDGTDYEKVGIIRRNNFEYADKLFGSINQIDIKHLYDEKCVPMVYPLMTEDADLVKRLLKAKHFQGNWWRYILDLDYANPFEKKLSANMVPITIDQRYNHSTLDIISQIVYGN